MRTIFECEGPTATPPPTRWQDALQESETWSAAPTPLTASKRALHGLSERRRGIAPWRGVARASFASGYLDTDYAIRTHCKAARTYARESSGQVCHFKIIPERDVYVSSCAERCRADSRKMLDDLGQTSVEFSADLPDACCRVQPALLLPKRNILARRPRSASSP